MDETHVNTAASITSSANSRLLVRSAFIATELLCTTARSFHLPHLEVVGLVRSPGPRQVAPIGGKEACAGLQVHDAAARRGVANNLEQPPFGNDFDGAGTTGPAEYDYVARAGKWRSIGERARASLFGVPVESPLADVPNVLAGRDAWSDQLCSGVAH